MKKLYLDKLHRKACAYLSFKHNVVIYQIMPVNTMKMHGNFKIQDRKRGKACCTSKKYHFYWHTWL